MDNRNTISATVGEDTKINFLVFCLTHHFKYGNTLKALLVWFLGLSLEDKEKFINQYGTRNRLPKTVKKASLHINLTTPREKIDIKTQINTLKSKLERDDITLALIVVSLISWFQGLNEESLNKFKDRYYFPGKEHTLQDIAVNASLKTGVIDVQAEKTTKRKVLVRK